MTRLALESATQLAHVLAARIADDAGIRVLSLKGPAADHYGLRPPRVSVDADVCVEPARFQEFCDLLALRGWSIRAGRTTPSILPLHSSTFVHPTWPCDMDVHRTFPGFFASEADVFETLWSARQRLSVAHHHIWVPSLPASAVVGLLHAFRNMSVPRHRAEAAWLIARLRKSSKAERADFYEIARRGGALWVLRDVIASTGLGTVVVDASPDDQRRWNLLREFSNDESTVGWWVAVRAAPWRRKVLLLTRALWVWRIDIPRADIQRMPSWREAWMYNLSRWRRGTRGTIRYFFVRHPESPSANAAETASSVCDSDDPSASAVSDVGTCGAQSTRL